MGFRDDLTEQLTKHPVMQPQDVVKLCYQAAFGAEHLLTDLDRAKAYFDQEYASVTAKDMVLFEAISPQVCRVNLCAWKYTGMPSEWLWHMFADTASVVSGSRELFLEYLKEAQEAVEQGGTGFTLAQWQEFLVQYEAAGMPAVHHSRMYREAEQPAYRIVRSCYLNILPILKLAVRLSDKSASKVIAVDGRAASGKSTMTALLEAVLEAGIVHMDDFFVPPVLRSEERFVQPGGNVHYERFIEEVLPCIEKTESFSYQIFDCGTMDYKGCREVRAAAWHVVEGSYSTHPVFGDYADIKVFLDVEPEEQIRRIEVRNGREMARMFQNRWIPLEEAYFKAYQVRENADIVICPRK